MTRGLAAAPPIRIAALAGTALSHCDPSLTKYALPRWPDLASHCDPSLTKYALPTAPDPVPHCDPSLT